MRRHERTHIAFDEQGNEYVIDEFHDGAGPEAPHPGQPRFRTRDGHEVECLSPGAFAVRIPGEEKGIPVWTHDATHV
ncbi:hypothetical protein [Halomonas koreensis]|uniref:Uncharacterized protein n=1 Tax=Halomonas koreensis TaxID=245385 RepID=A0ABU1FZA0_9GAMM|nr:hypothetical protein [Halomonas koreensis]MDR5865683.1 hypothetical protein [Halomonas koreensis]